MAFWSGVQLLQWRESINYRKKYIQVRIMCNKSYNYHTEPLFKQHNILTPKDQYRYNVGIFMHNMRRNKVPISFSNFK